MTIVLVPGGPLNPDSSEMCDSVHLGRRGEEDCGFRVPLEPLATLVCHQLKQSPAPGHAGELPPTPLRQPHTKTCF